MKLIVERVIFICLFTADVYEVFASSRSSRVSLPVCLANRSHMVVTCAHIRQLAGFDFSWCIETQFSLRGQLGEMCSRMGCVGHDCKNDASIFCHTTATAPDSLLCCCGTVGESYACDASTATAATCIVPCASCIYPVPHSKHRNARCN